MPSIKVLNAVLFILLVKGPVLTLVLRSEKPPPWDRVLGTLILSSGATLAIWLFALPHIWQDSIHFNASTMAIFVAIEAIIIHIIAKNDRFQLSFLAAFLTNLAVVLVHLGLVKFAEMNLLFH